jgi:hypothetical protein
MSYFDVPTRWVIPEAALRCSLQEMAIDGARGCEGVAMWLGHYDRDTAVVTHIAVLRARPTPHRRRPDERHCGSCDRASPETHRPNPFARATDLSKADRAYGIGVAGYVSAVAPDYAMRANTPISECGVYVFEPRTGWRRLSADELSARVRMVRERDCRS